MPPPIPTGRMPASSTDRALQRAMTELLADHTELFKQFSDNESFRKWLSEMSFAATYERAVEDVRAPIRRLMQTGPSQSWRTGIPGMCGCG